MTSTDKASTSTDTAQTTPSPPEDEISEQGTSGVGQYRHQYGLRQRVTPPERWMGPSSGQSLKKGGGGDVTDPEIRLTFTCSSGITVLIVQLFLFVE